MLTIGTYTFYHCSGLTEVVIPDKVTSIGNSAFYYCTGLTTLTIGSAVTSIGMSGFRNCTNLKTVTVKAEECALGNSAFAVCDNLAAIYVPSGRVEYYKGATNWSAYSGIIHSVVASGYCGVPSVNDGKDVTWTLTEDGVMTISGTGAMQNYSNAGQVPWNSNKGDITSVVIGDGVTSIGSFTFSGCSNLTTISFGSGLTTINSNAFQNCTSLTEVTLPASVTTVMGSFNGCTNLATVTLNSNPAIVGTTAFPSGATVTMNLTAHEGETGEFWMTFYNKNQNFQVPATGTQIFKAALSGTALTLTELETDKIVTKDNAVILKSTTGSTISLTLTTTASSNDFSGNSLLGVSAAAGLTAADPSTTFVLNNGTQGVGFYRLATGKTLGVGKAYLTYSEPSSAPSFLGFGGNGEGTTGVNEVRGKTEDVRGEYYDLQGRRVAQPTKGLYIVNGKKVIIK